jgi:hypothetical protein
VATVWLCDECDACLHAGVYTRTHARVCTHTPTRLCVWGGEGGVRARARVCEGERESLCGADRVGKAGADPGRVRPARSPRRYPFESVPFILCLRLLSRLGTTCFTRLCPSLYLLPPPPASLVHLQHVSLSQISARSSMSSLACLSAVVSASMTAGVLRACLPAPVTDVTAL